MTRNCICGKRANFGYIEDGLSRWCKKCSQQHDGVIDVKSNKCECGNRATFGFPGGKALWCKDCRQEGYVSINGKKCICGKTPTFGLPGGKALWCKDCRQEGYVSVVGKKCICGKQPKFGLHNDKTAVWCKDCKPQDAVDIKHSFCPGGSGNLCPSGYRTMPNKQYCLACDPDETRRLSRKRDEEAFFLFLAKNDINITQREYRIDYKCIETNRVFSRIDGIIINKEIVICIEVDEMAHEFYKCDEARMNDASAEISIAFPDRHIAWLRINPNVSNVNGKRDRSYNAIKIRNIRHSDGLAVIQNLIKTPRTGIIYIGFV